MGEPVGDELAVTPNKKKGKPLKEVLHYHTFLLPCCTGKGLAHPLHYLGSCFVPAAQHFNGHWLEYNSFGLTNIPVFPPFLIISMLESMARVLRSFGNQLILKAADDTHIDSTVAPSTEVRKKNVGRTLLNPR